MKKSGTSCAALLVEDCELQYRSAITGSVTHDGVDLVILEDIYLTVAEEFLSWVRRIGIYLCGGRSICFVDSLDSDLVGYWLRHWLPIQEREACNRWCDRNFDCKGLAIDFAIIILAISKDDGHFRILEFYLLF